MGGMQDIIERVKYADAKLKKQIVLGSLAGVLFIVAAVLLIRGLMGPGPAEAPSQVQQAADDLRQKLDDGETQEVDDSQQPFTGAPQTAG